MGLPSDPLAGDATGGREGEREERREREGGIFDMEELKGGGGRILGKGDFGLRA